MNRFMALVPVCAGTLIGLGTPALGAFDTLYGCEYPGFTDLSTLDQTNGAISSVGPSGWSGLADMTSDTREGSFRMWSVQSSSNTLVTIDPVTGIATAGPTLNAPDQIVSLAFDSVTGKLYGNSSVGFGAPFDALYEIDPDNGDSTFIGRILFENVYALAFDQGGTLYGVSDVTDDLISISTASGNGTHIADLPQLSAFDIASRPSDNTMFLANSQDFTLYTINTGNGDMTPVGLFGGGENVVGLAFGPVPAPGAVSALVLAGMGMARRRSRR